MPSMKAQSTLAAAAIENVLTGLDFEFLPWDALVSLYASVSAVTGTVGFKADAASLLADGSVPNVAAAAGIVRRPEDLIVDQEFVPAGARLKLRAVGTAAAETLNWWVLVERIPGGRQIR